MQPRTPVQYTDVPDCQSWIIPFWDSRDRDEFDDLTSSIRMMGPERFADPIRAFERAVNQSEAVGVRFYVGTRLPDRVTLPLAPDTREQAIDILTEASGFMVDERGVVPWGQICSRLIAIRDAVSQSDEGAYPSFGFSAVIPSHRDYTEASTDWIGRD